MTPPVPDADQSLPGPAWWRVLVVALASHHASSSESPPAWGAVLALTPASTALAMALWRLPRRWIGEGAIVLAGDEHSTIADAVRAWKAYNASNAHKAP